MASADGRQGSGACAGVTSHHGDGEAGGSSCRAFLLALGQVSGYAPALPVLDLAAAVCHWAACRRIPAGRAAASGAPGGACQPSQSLGGQGNAGAYGFCGGIAARHVAPALWAPDLRSQSPASWCFSSRLAARRESGLNASSSAPSLHSRFTHSSWLSWAVSYRTAGRSCPVGLTRVKAWPARLAQGTYPGRFIIHLPALAAPLGSSPARGKHGITSGTGTSGGVPARPSMPEHSERAGTGDRYPLPGAANTRRVTIARPGRP
jgi:hypothetical protein